MKPEIILASASPRRAELLRQIGVSFRVLATEINETVRAGEAASDYVLRLAQEKARTGAELAAAQDIHLPVLAADTIVECDGEILGKPVGAHQAQAMLAMLSARQHVVHTALCIYCAGRLRSVLSSSQVEFAALTPAEIEAYVASGEPLDKAGGYAIQGLGGQFIRNLNGSYSGVMGLPLYETCGLLKSCETGPFSCPDSGYDLVTDETI